MERIFIEYGFRLYFSKFKYLRRCFRCMTFQQIRYIQEIARCGSISQAASRLYIAQSALSGTVRDLEAQLGVMLFSRSSKGVCLTEEGRQFLTYAEPLLAQHDKLMSLYAQKQEQPTLQISISFLRFVYILKSIVSVLHEFAGDRYEIHIREEGMHQIIKAVQSGTSQIGFIYISDATKHIADNILSNQGLTWTPIARISPCIFFREDHPLAKRENIHLSDMEDYPLIIFEEEDFVALDYAEEISSKGLHPNRKRIYIEDRATMVDLVTHTDAFCIGTAIWSKSYIGDGCMVGKVIADHEEDLMLGYIQKETNRLPEPILNRILEHIHCELANQEHL